MPLTRTTDAAVKRAGDQSTSYIWAAEALALLGPAYGAIAAAERVLLRNAARIPWTWADVDPPGAPAEELWQHLTYTLKPRLAENAAEFRSIEFGIVTVSGIKFERAAVKALLPAGTVPTIRTDDVADTLAPPAPDAASLDKLKSARTCKEWLTEAEKLLPRNKGEKDALYATRLANNVPGFGWKVSRITNIFSEGKRSAGPKVSRKSFSRRKSHDS